MQNKGAIRLFAILLAIASLYTLSFTWITSSVEKEASEYANGDLSKKQQYLDSIANEVVYNIGIRKYTYAECQEREINLGLDLKGGMNVTLEVSVIELIKAMSNNPNDTVLINTIKETRNLQKSNTEDNFVTLFGRAFEQLYPGARLAAFFNTPELKDRINYNSTNEEVIAVLAEEATSAISNSFNVLRTRIDRFGVTQPNIQKLEGTGRILVELPGIKEPERVRKLLQGTAQLEFWETYENSEVYPFLLEANKKIKEIQDAKKKLENTDTDTTKVSESEEVITEETTVDTLSVNEDEEKEEDDVDLLTQMEEQTDSLEADSLNAADQAELMKDYPLFSVLNPRSDGQQLYPGPAIGLAHFKDTGKVNAFLAMDQVRNLFPRDLKFAWTIKAIDEGEQFYQLIAIKVPRNGKAPLDGDVITSARKEFDNMNRPEVSISMNSEGTNKWRRLTKENIGKSIAIVLDNYVYSFPTVNGEIPSGRSSITGVDATEAEDLANVLKSGKLPAPARIIQEEIVGPSLGKEAISSGLMSFLVAFIVILLYMVFYYNRAGLVADIALITNIFFIMGVLASIGAVLTLPGIAGIVLTIGMSVDANVLIYERIKEELNLGKGLKLAITDGYKNAYSAIIDANITTLLTGIILYIFGTGPIKGFATTLVIGILTSLFAAIFITRLIFTWWLSKNRTTNFATKLTENAFKNLNVKFLEKRKIFYVVSGIVITIGIASLFVRGLNFGVDFKGGRTYVVRFEQPVSTVEVASELKSFLGDHSPEVKVFGEDNQVKITTKYLIDYAGLNSEGVDLKAHYDVVQSLLNNKTFEDFKTDVNEKTIEIDDIVEMRLFLGLKKMYKDADYSDFVSDKDDKAIGRMSSQKVGPTIADDIKVAAVWSILFSLIVIFLYILMRFKTWQYGLGAIVALIHDVLFILGIFSLLYGIVPFSLEIDQAFIAAILTVVGYSINDTVVVFDRLREYLGMYKKRDRKEIISSALNSTISRTFSTSLSTFFVLLTIFVFGGEVIRGFTFALLIGVFVGTYSSLFIATPVAYEIMKPEDKNTKNKGKK